MSATEVTLRLRFERELDENDLERVTTLTERALEDLGCTAAEAVDVEGDI